MKRHQLRRAASRVAFLAPVLLLAVAATPPAQARPDQAHSRTRYEVSNLASLGGTDSAGNSVNNRGDRKSVV